MNTSPLCAFRLSRLLGFMGLISMGLRALAVEPVAGGVVVDDLRDGDSARVEMADGVAIATIKCPRGIGHCTVVPGKGRWPERFAVLLAGFREVEHFEVRFGRIHAQGSRKSSGKFELHVPGEGGNISAGSGAGTLNVKVEVRKDGVLVSFPARFFSGSDRVSLSWIDWLRR